MPRRSRNAPGAGRVRVAAPPNGAAQDHRTGAALVRAPRQFWEASMRSSIASAARRRALSRRLAGVAPSWGRRRWLSRICSNASLPPSNVVLCSMGRHAQAWITTHLRVCEAPRQKDAESGCTIKFYKRLSTKYPDEVAHFPGQFAKLLSSASIRTVRG